IVRRFEIALDENLAQQLEDESSRRGLAIEEYLLRLIEQRATGLMPRTPTAWMAREEWEALVRGEGCPLCAALAADEQVNAHGYTIADLRLSRLRLAANQSVPGYCYLICKKHVAEPHYLGPDERGAFFEDLTAAARAIERAFKPIKMNLEMLGNVTPHLH